MRLTFTGRQEAFTPAQTKKMEAKMAKLAKLMDSRGGERDARVIFTAERHLRRAEITVNVLDHPMVGVATEGNEFTALFQAVERLEKQVLKLRAKKRDTKREPKQAWDKAGRFTAAEPGFEEASGKRIFRVDEHANRKPMTLEEAVLELDAKRDYVVYIDAETDRVSVLLRRRDGHLDLVEA
ncbi:MAG TPA: HPF/RaiA family ribosome-associated protein [Bryobacteraceae bacterium]|nr:HPF/RaiA family ribosome-associated protein [Bryobacteraceae bacterium]